MRRLLLTPFLLVLLSVPASTQEIKAPLAPGKDVPGPFHPFNVTSVDYFRLGEEGMASLASQKVPKPTLAKLEGIKGVKFATEAAFLAEVGKVLPPEELETHKANLVKYGLVSSRGRYHCLVSEYDDDPVVLLFTRGLPDNPAFRSLLTKLETAITRNPTVRLRCFVVVQDPALPEPIKDDDKRNDLARNLEKFATDLKLDHIVLTLGSKSTLEKYKVDEAAALTALLYRKLKIISSYAVPADKLDEELVKTILGDVASKLGATR